MSSFANKTDGALEDEWTRFNEKIAKSKTST